MKTFKEFITESKSSFRLITTVENDSDRVEVKKILNKNNIKAEWSAENYILLFNSKSDMDNAKKLLSTYLK